MGIKDLSKFLKTKYPEAFELIHLSSYAYKKIAIDTSLYLCHYKALNPDNWLQCFINLVTCLRKNEVHCVFIYDTSSPPEKQVEKKRRHDVRQKLDEKVCKLENAIEEYHCTNIIDPILLEFEEKKKIKSKSLLQSNQNFNINAIQSAVQKLRKQLFTISPEDFATTKELFDILDVPYFNAPLEAETLCSDLCIQEKVDAVLSEDTDVLAYGAPVFLTKINIKDETCIRIDYKKLLEMMNMDSNQFLDFCIMCGTDYNSNIYKIGPVKAEKLILENKSIDNISNLDVSILNHKRVRQLFREYEKSNISVQYCGFPDEKKLSDFITKYKVKIDLDRLYENYKRKIIIE
jgi:5'-3' exonuclease